jgi:subtilisin family serine protease
MNARHEKRRTSQRDFLFSDPVKSPIGEFRGLRPRAVEDFGPCRPIALLSDVDHDVFIVPLLVSVRRDSGIEKVLTGGSFLPEEIRGVEMLQETGDFGVRTYRFVPRDPGDAGQQTQSTMRWIGELVAGNGPDASPVYGFSAHQHWMGAEDAEASAAVATPVGSQGDGVRIEVLDTGLDTAWQWKAALSGFTGDAEVLHTSMHPDYLSRAAGHGTFISGVLGQIAPAATVHVTRLVNAEGFLDELSMSAAIRALAKDPPDIIVICSGGHAVALGSFGTPGASGLLHPLSLLDAFTTFLASTSGCVMVMSAGNENASDLSFPAGFAKTLNNGGRLISVGALDDDGWRASFSNFGDWVTCSALGVRLQSTFVEGKEDPMNETDFTPEVWGPYPFAQWSGTSFSTPQVAAQIANELSAMRTKGLTTAGGGVMDALTAWQIMLGTSKPCVEPECGQRILVDGAAHG